MPKVLVIASSRKTRGGITAVLKLYEQSPMWRQYRCRWIGTHRDGGTLRKIWYFIKALAQYLLLLPFYDIVHIHFSLTVSAIRKYPFFLLAKLLGKKTVIHLHCGSQIDKIWNATYQTMFERCDCAILLSEGLKVKIARHLGNSDKLKVVYNPCPTIIDTTKYDKRNHILFIGTLHEGKGYKDLIRAFAAVAPRHPEWKLLLAGNGEMDQAHGLACDLGIGKQVELLGWVDGADKYRILCEARVLCHPSYEEGFPMAVLDAWAYGLPVVTTPVGGIPDVAVDNENMLLFNPGDVETLSRKLELIITGGELRTRLSATSRQLARDTFSLENITRQVAKIYDDIT